MWTLSSVMERKRTEEEMEICSRVMLDRRQNQIEREEVL